MKDELGERMKSYYENRSRYKLLRRTFTIIRIDGKAFHTYTRGLGTPFDTGLIEDMDATAAYLCKNIQGAKYAYVQSDEISILITDFDDIKTDMWFDGNVQKIASVSASLATSEFNRLRLFRRAKEIENDPLMKTSVLFDLVLEEGMRQAHFDSRVFQIPSSIEVVNYFIWRQQDATRNSIQSTGQSLYSSKELHGKSTNDVQELIFQKGINWNDYTTREKRGGIITKVVFEFKRGGETYLRKKWTSVECPIFTANKEFLEQYVPGVVKSTTTTE